VLVDKMEEYRQIEDAMRSTLLTAQKTASGIVAEAEAKRDAIIADAAGAPRSVWPRSKTSWSRRSSASLPPTRR